MQNYHTSRATLLESDSKFRQHLLHEHAKILGLLRSQVDNLIANISGVEEITKVLNDKDTSLDNYDNLVTKARIGYILNGYLNLKGLVSIDIFTEGGRQYHVGDTLSVDTFRRDIQQQIRTGAIASDPLIYQAGIIPNLNKESKYKHVLASAKIINAMNRKTLEKKPIALLVVSYNIKQFAEYFSLYMVSKGHDVSVFNSHTHPFQLENWKGVKIIHKNDPEDKIGTVGQFIYDLNCINHCRKVHFDIILQLGYTSSSVWGKLLPKKSLTITNMDGLEWKRSKYGRPVRKFLKIAESLAIRNSDYLISDSIGIKNYIEKTYDKDSKYIAYGADIFNTPDKAILEKYDVKSFGYNMLIARLEPENNIETILDGACLSKHKEPFLVIGKHDINKFGSYLKSKYKNQEHIKFIGGIYDLSHLNNLRYYSKFYFQK